MGQGCSPNLHKHKHHTGWKRLLLNKFQRGSRQSLLQTGEEATVRGFFSLSPPSQSRIQPGMTSCRNGRVQPGSIPLEGPGTLLSKGNFIACRHYCDKWQGLSDVASQHLDSNVVTSLLSLCPHLSAKPWCLLLSLSFLLSLFLEVPNWVFGEFLLES